MGAYDDAMIRILDAVAAARGLSPAERSQLRVEFERDPETFLERHAAEVSSIRKEDLNLFRPEPL